MFPTKMRTGSKFKSTIPTHVRSLHNAAVVFTMHNVKYLSQFSFGVLSTTIQCQLRLLMLQAVFQLRTVAYPRGS